MNAKTMICALFIAGALMAQKSEPPAPDASYYPLAVGMAWEYKLGPIQGVTSRKTCKVRQYRKSDKSFVLENNNYTTHNGQTANFDGGERLRVTAQGVFRVATWNWLHNGQVQESNTCLLKFPIQIGSTWTKKEGDANGELTTTRTILRKSEVSIGAGSYRDVIVVQVKVQGVLDYREGKAYKSEEYEYYAPNVGLIKTEFLDERTGQISTMGELVRFIPDIRELDRALERNRLGRNP